MLKRIPFWGWLVIILVALYSVYNPLGFSLLHMWLSPDIYYMLPLKVLATVFVGTILGLVLNGVRQTMSILGFLAITTLIAVPLWVAYTYLSLNLASYGIWCWIAQPIMALILTIGWQWSKIWRGSTGIVSVEEVDTPV